MREKPAQSPAAEGRDRFHARDATQLMTWNDEPVTVERADVLELTGATALAQGGGGGPPRLAPLLMESTAFEDGGIVPQKYAGREGVQPGFTFSNAPDGTVSYAIIFHDIDVALQGGTNDVLHWIAWNIPAAAKGIPEGALNANLDLPNTAGRPELLAAMAGKIVAKAAYVGRFRGTPTPPPAQ